MTDTAMPMVVLISGSGSNLQAIIDAIAEQTLNARIEAVISNRAHAYGLERAREAGIETRVIEHQAYADRASFDTALMQLIDSYEPQLVVLAGFMRILSDEFVHHYEGRMLNIHPSLLPEFKGLHTHKRAIDAGHRRHGASVHFVTAELDGGPVIVQAEVPINDGDDTETLAARVLEQEHVIYPLSIQWYADGRLELKDHRVYLDQQPLQQPALIKNGQLTDAAVDQT